ncbi:MAG TPA: PEP/pyruvate-binding domain-containing protein [Pseudomonadales bacterium]|nr:PEP/pyruvate-binding domain-containing protein [Pseudomonadales bacterium]
MPHIIPLQKITNEAVGGKAEGLAKLIRLGLHVPAGFVIQHAEPGNMPSDLLAQYHAIGGGKVAVRSSAIGEDSVDASFAGQYETILDVEGDAALVAAIEQCLHSIQNVSAMAYQSKKSADANAEMPVVEMCVVVQTMVPAAVAGVLFTADPVTSSRQHIVIDAVSGLGEKLVSGEATPDHYVLDRSGKIIEQDLVGSSALLSTQQLQTLLQEALNAEAKMGFPLDMEWAINQEGVLCWLQARPITTLGADLNELDTPLLDEKHIYTRCNVSEALPGALCPLTHSVTGRGLEVGMQRLFIDFGILQKEDNHWYVMSNFYGHMFMNLSTMSWTALKAFGTNADDLAMAVCGRLIPELNEGFVKPSLIQRIPVLIKYFKTLFSAGKHSSALQKQAESVALSHQRSALAQWKMIDSFMGEMQSAHHSHLVSSTVAGMMMPLLLGILAKGKTVTDEHHTMVAALLAGAEDVESADIAQGADRIQKLLLQQPHVRERFIEVSSADALGYLRSADSGAAGKEFSRYIARHGHRSISEMDLRVKEWACDPQPLIETLQVSVRGLLGQPIKKAHAASASTSASTGNLLYQQQNAVIRYLVRIARGGVVGREFSKSRLIAIKRMFKQAYRELAQMMVVEKFLPDVDAVYFLTHEELGECLNSPASSQWGERAMLRRAAMKEQQALQFPDVFVGKPSPLQPDLSQLPADKIVRGKTVSRGCVTGIAKVARVVSEANKLEAGDILIAPITDIAWTPYFSLIGGLATDIGSAVSHGAVVAREYGLPAIVKTDIGTQVFQDGDVVVLDANHGILRPATEEEKKAFLIR